MVGQKRLEELKEEEKEKSVNTLKHVEKASELDEEIQNESNNLSSGLSKVALNLRRTIKGINFLQEEGKTDPEFVRKMEKYMKFVENGLEEILDATDQMRVHAEELESTIEEISEEVNEEVKEFEEIEKQIQHT